MLLPYGAPELLAVFFIVFLAVLSGIAEVLDRINKRDDL